MHVFVSEYLHQVRSYKRTISATMLFTADVDNSFQDTGCEDAKFEYTPLSAIDVHWNYKKGDKTIDMGYVNIETIRRNLFVILDTFDQEYFTLDDFAHYHSLALEEDESGVLHVHSSINKVILA